MSMQEMFGFHMELEALKKVLKDITGMKFDGKNLVSGQENEIAIIKNTLVEIHNYNISLKERIDKMALNIETLEREVARAQTVQSSAVMLLKKLKFQQNQFQ